ncbi:unnamed protein product [Toxocara canis]|uniref:Protein FAR1-RELATED SEQUENCE n=1 Tax=Toxocara canis TaxID=6265 RepID=A0A183VDG6_TOXCA|nr:unnamed protein product [Toxocara canis]
MKLKKNKGNHEATIDQKVSNDANLGLKTNDTSSSSNCDDDANQTAIESSPISDLKDNKLVFDEANVHETKQNDMKEKAQKKANEKKKTCSTPRSSQRKLPIEETYKREAEENEYFDPHFYKNVIATRQHDQTKRSCETLAERKQRDCEVVEMKVLAKVVDDHNDHIGVFSSLLAIT